MYKQEIRKLGKLFLGFSEQTICFTPREKLTEIKKHLLFLNKYVDSKFILSI